MSTATFGSSSRIMLMAIIRLYANLHSPVYHIVVGDVAGEANISRVLQKLGHANNDDHGSLASDSHWLPRVLPLPFWAAGSR